MPDRASLADRLSDKKLDLPLVLLLDFHIASE